MCWKVNNLMNYVYSIRLCNDESKNRSESMKKKRLKYDLVCRCIMTKALHCEKNLGGSSNKIKKSLSRCFAAAAILGGEKRS